MMVSIKTDMIKTYLDVEYTTYIASDKLQSIKDSYF